MSTRVTHYDDYLVSVVIDKGNAGRLGLSDSVFLLFFCEKDLSEDDKRLVYTILRSTGTGTESVPVLPILKFVRTRTSKLLPVP